MPELWLARMAGLPNPRKQSFQKVQGKGQLIVMNFDDFLSISNAEEHWQDLAKVYCLPVEVIGNLHRESWDLISYPPNRKYIGLVFAAKIREQIEIFQNQDFNK